MKKVLLALALTVSVVGVASADMSTVVFITHAAAVPSFSPCGDYYAVPLGITACDQQNVQVASGSMVTWYVVVAFDTDTAGMCGYSFGFTDYTPSLMTTLSSGPCPSNAVGTATAGFPGPLEGGAYAVAPDIAWTGNFFPVYAVTANFAGDGVIPLGVDPRTGTANVGDCAEPPVLYDAVCLGALGVGTGIGIECCPQAGPEPQACCFEDGSCQLLLPDACAAAGGEVYPEFTCDPNPCPPPTFEVCCIVEVCQLVLNVDECDQLGGVYYPDWDTCDPNPCPVTPAEETSWGSIKAIYR